MDRWSSSPGPATEQRHTRRVQAALLCSLRRRTGSAIAARTIDIGPGGMRIAADRPLRVDEVLDFEVPDSRAGALAGRARVMREQSYGVYGMRFEMLADTARDCLAQLVAGPSAL